MKAPTATLRLALPLAAALLACATGGGAPRGAAAGGPAPSAAAPASGAAAARSGGRAASAPAAPPGRELSPRAQRLFDEAVAAEAEQRKLQVPTDWETLERRWRAVTEAEAVPEAFFNLGVALQRRGKLDEARAAYRRALDLEPRLAPAAANLLLLDEPADPAAAAQRWAELARRFPDEAVARERLAALYEAAGQRDEAWRLAREALLREPRSVGAYKVMMRVALARGEPDLAHLLAVKARKLDGRDPEIVAFVGDALAAEKDHAGAVAQWRKAVALDGSYLPARYALLADAFGKQHWEGVAEQARAILGSSPDARVQLALGVALRYLGKPDQALAAYDQAEKLGGRLPEVHLDRGVALMRSKEQCEPALAELRRYVAEAGPAAAAEGPAPKLIRECEQIVLAGRQAEEAARELQAQQQREAARKAAAPAAPPPKEAPPAAGRGAEMPPPASPAGAPAAAASPARTPTSTADGR